MDNEEKTARDAAMQRAIPRNAFEAHLLRASGVSSSPFTRPASQAGNPNLTSAPPDAQIRALKAKVSDLEAKIENMTTLKKMCQAIVKYNEHRDLDSEQFLVRHDMFLKIREALSRPL